MTPSDWYNPKDDPFHTSDDDSTFRFDSPDDYSFDESKQSGSDPFALPTKSTFSRFGNGNGRNSGSSGSPSPFDSDSQWSDSSWGSKSSPDENDAWGNLSPSGSSGWTSGGSDVGNTDWGSASNWGGSSGKRSRKRKPSGLLFILTILAAAFVVYKVWTEAPSPQVSVPHVTAPAATEDPDDTTQILPPTQPVVPPPVVTDPPVTVPPTTEADIPVATDPPYSEPPIVQPLYNVTYYCRGLLTPSQQKLYDELYAAVACMSEEKIPVQATEEDLNMITNFVAIDHPELFWYGGCCTYYYITEEDGSWTYTDIVPTYDFTRDQVMADLPIIEAYAEDCLRGLEHIGEYGQVKAVFEYIINNTFYDLDYGGQSMHEIMVKNRGVCTSYAKATQYLLQRLGFECIVVSGGNHAWNIVKVEGEYYQLDTTWGDPVVERIEDSVLNYNYFLVTSQEMYRDHTLESTFTVPNCTATSCNYYVREGLMFDTYDEARFLDIMYRDASAERNTTLRCGNRQVYDTFLSILKDGGKIYPLLERLGVSNLRTDSLTFGSDESYLIVTVNFQFQ